MEAHRTYEFHGIQVKFPHEANQTQRDMMDKILSEITAGRNLITEAVTGTGKTLALLCPLLAWLENQATREGNKAEFSPSKKLKSSGPLIFYATKTLAHIKHIIGQLRLTKYSNTPMGILASVKQTCNNEEADEHLCEYLHDELQWSDHLSSQPIQAWDLEDLKGFCHNTRTCSYYEMMNANKKAKIIFCTYNYLLHPGIRQALNISLQGNILVFDEGHNVEDLCREIASTPAHFFTLANVTEMTEILRRRLALQGLQNNPREHVRRLTTTFQNFRDYLSCKLGTVVNNDRSAQRLSFDEILRDLNAVGLGPNHLEQLKTDIVVLKEFSSDISLRSENLQFRTNAQIIKYLVNSMTALDWLWEGHPHQFLNSNFYNISLQRTYLWLNPEGEDEEVPKDIIELSKTDIELKLICLKAAVAFNCTEEARSVMVASATLSPIETTALELGIEFTSQLSANHVTPPERVFVAIVDRHANGSDSYLKLTSDNWRECESEFQDQVAKIIQDICRLVPHGVVVFMPTKQRVERLMSIWGQNGHLETIRNLKDVFIEPNEEVQDGLNAMLEQYKRLAQTERGAILFAVMRGRLSDGIEFRDNQARALVTIGIPFGPVNDPSVEANREYQDSLIPTGGWDWYCGNAFKALNQAIGRNIRHAQDWGAIFLVDSRFESNGYAAHLPLWVTNSLASGSVGRSMVDVIPDFNAFLTRMV